MESVSENTQRFPTCSHPMHFIVCLKCFYQCSLAEGSFGSSGSGQDIRHIKCFFFCLLTELQYLIHCLSSVRKGHCLFYYSRHACGCSTSISVISNET